MLKRFDVIIAGGGMVGAALAASLGQQGKSVCVLEAAPEPPRILADDPMRPRVVALNYSSQRLLNNLGVWHQLLAWRGTAYRRMSVWDGGGFGEIEFDAIQAGVPDLGHILENHLIERALYERCAAMSDRITWLSETPITNFVADAESVIVTLENGHILTGSLLVGADGARSRVRELAGFEWQRTDYRQKGIVALIETDRPHQQEAWQAFRDNGVLAFLPVTGGGYSIVWSVDNDAADQLLTLSDAEFKRTLTSTIDARPGIVRHVGERSAFPLNGAKAGSYIGTRVALMGDAAHLVHPLAGQGVNLGFSDVLGLSSLIENSVRDLGGASLLRAYERSRAGENQAMRRLMEGFQHLFMNRNPVLGFARGMGLGLVNRATPLKHEMMRVAFGA